MIRIQQTSTRYSARKCSNKEGTTTVIQITVTSQMAQQAAEYESPIVSIIDSFVGNKLASRRVTLHCVRCRESAIKMRVRRVYVWGARHIA